MSRPGPAWRTAGWISVALLAGTAAWPALGWRVAAGELGGVLLSSVSYWSIQRGVDGLAPGRTLARTLSILIGRYALLALIAYVMIARLRMSPLGLLLGVSVIPAAVSMEAFASSGRRTRE